ncbi:hypothetical protein TWF225_009342 [Orbilia oligospora]|nr:hypothetical protein TWF225_009342 [Orbilia oligospora]KAF3269980.1 hypothetical protein TWF217_008326 [Orbilia oligospora]KAF3270445.1 hypothetical protein TWF128_004218 [Orbilia oligospora]KAF3298070.1 hypothetical protein TWF132_004208 [Orbilia oligospora]
MPVKRTTARARSAPGQLHRAPYRQSPPPSPRHRRVTTITVTAPTPTSGGGPEGSASQVTAGMPFDIRMFLRTRRVAAGGVHSSSPFLLGEPRETASPRPRSPLQRRRHGSEPPLEGLPVPLKKISRCGVKKTVKGSSRQKGPRPNATSSQRKPTTKPGDKRRGRPTEAEAVRILDEAGSARTERLVRSDQRRSGVRNQGQLMTPPSARTGVVAGQPTGNGNGDETGPPTRRSVRRGVRRIGGIVREQPLEAPIDENTPEEGVRTTVRRRRAVTTNTRAPVAVLSGQRRGADGRVAPVRGEPVPALHEQGTRHNRDGERRRRAPSASRSQGGIQPPRQLPREETLGASDHLLTMINTAAEERYLRDLLQLRRRVEETFVPEGRNARTPAPRVQAPRRVGLSEIPMNVLNHGPVVVRGREVRQGVVTNHRRPRQRPGARIHEDNLRGALDLR